MRSESRAAMRPSVANPNRQRLIESPPPRDFAAAIRVRVTAASRADLTLPLREAMREPPQFGQGR